MTTCLAMGCPSEIMKWGELKSLLPQLFFSNTEVVLQYFAFTVTRYAHIFTSVSICVIKIHLVSYSCLEKGKFTLPKKVMLKQNKGHLRGFPHPNPSKWLPFQSFFFSLQKHGSWLQNWEKNQSTPPLSWTATIFQKAQSLWSPNCPPKFSGDPIQLVIFKTLTKYDWSKGNWSLSLVTRMLQGQTGIGAKMC